MYYTDFASFEEISVTAVGNTAEVGTPGAFSNFVSKSGSNKYHGTVYFDYENDAMEAHNIDDAQIAAGVRGSQFLDARDLNRLSLFRDFTADIGGYVKKDRLWWYFCVPQQRRRPAVPDARRRHPAHVWPCLQRQGHRQRQHEPQAGGYYQHAGKVQPDYLGAIALATGRDTTAIMHADTVWSSGYPNDISKGEYNGTLSNRLFLMVRGGAMKSYWYRDYKSSAPRIEDISTNFVSGGVFGIDNGRFRPQVNASLSYFKSDWAGTHNFKFGGEIMRDDLDQPFRGFGDPCQCVSVFSNGVPSQVYLYQRRRQFLETGLWATRVRERLLAGEQAVDAQSRSSPRPIPPFLPGADRTRRADVCRRGQGPDLEERRSARRRQLRRDAARARPWSRPTTASTGCTRLAISPAPSTRILPTWRQIYTWNDLNSNGRWESGEQVGSPTSVSGGTASTIYDPDIQNTFSHQVLAFVEHEAAPNFGVRTGFVWNGRRQLRGSRTSTGR